MRDVVITGVGLCTPLGGTFPDFSNALSSGACAIRPLETRFAGTIAAALVQEDVDQHFSKSLLATTDRVARLGLLAGTRAIEDARLNDAASCSDKGAVYIGSGSGPGVSESYETLFRTGRIPALTLLKCMHSAVASHASIQFGMRAGNQVYAAACASASVAIGEAMRAIRHGYIDYALVGGTESPFSAGVTKAWDAMRVLAPLDTRCATTVCRPFSADRRGLVLGEGAVFFVLESAEQAHARGAAIHAYMTGYGAASDACHLTEPDVQGQVTAMSAALADAARSTADIAYINAHGTGTKAGDAVEARSIRTVFGDTLPPTSTTKPAHGHLLGASGAIELAACLAALKTSQAAPTLNLDRPDHECALNHITRPAMPIAKGDSCLSNSFAFGGMNACLVVSSSPRQAH
jgi:3-oxoacyl-[acyl-carrier-protein] synthase II